MKETKTAQQDAIDFVDTYAQETRQHSLQTLAVICDRSNEEHGMIETIISNIQNNAQIAVHFHPDALNVNEVSVSESLLDSGIYLNQFVTHLSNGLLAPEIDGQRAKWEDMLFGSAYQSVDLSLRPKYGSLSLLPSLYGPSPRFGSCYFLLKPECMRHSTFCYGDSSSNPKERGTWKTLENVVAALFVDCFTNEQVLGLSNIRPPHLFAHLRQDLYSRKALQDCISLRNLNHYIEAQIHCEISLSKHVTTLVADPSYQHSKYGDVLQKICSKYNISLQWHDGFQLDVHDVVDNFRGNLMSTIARKIAVHDIIHAEIIGKARIDAVKNPQKWEQFEEPPSQLLKCLWHVLLRFGGKYQQKQNKDC